MNVVRSFDVFDTVLTRRTGEPASIFFLLGTKAHEQGLISITAAAFRSLRIFAETQARQVEPAQEPTLADIYQQLAGLIGLSAENSRLLLNLELETEEQLLVAVPGMRERVQAMRETGAKIIFLSDTYLPAIFLKKLLTEHQIFKPQDYIFASCEHKSSKRDGNLFKKVLTAEKIDSDHISHVGNDFTADFSVPTKLKIASTHWAEGNLGRYENILENFAVDTEGLSSLFAGASRLARLDLQMQFKAFESIKDVSCGVVGPTLCAFMIWLLSRAKHRGIKRLYFLSRDGYILHQIATRIQHALGIKIDLRYLYASRQAWHSAGLTQITASDQDWILDKTDNATPRSVLKRLNIAPEEIRESLENSGIDEGHWNEKMRNEDYIKLWTVISENKVVTELILEKATAARKLAIRYFAQEGMMDGNSFAIVDLGWHGRMEMSFRRIMNGKTKSFVGGMYFGLHATAVPEVVAKAETFLFGAGKPSSEIPCVAPLLEIFCTAPHATLAAYVFDDGKINPSFRLGHQDIILQWGLEALHTSIIRFAERLTEVLVPKHTTISMHLAVSSLLAEFSAKPSLNEAIAWGKFPYEDGQADDGYLVFLRAPTVGVRSLFRAVYYGSIGFLYDTVPKIYWSGGADVLAKTNKTFQIALKFGRFNSRLRQRLKRLAKII